MPNSGTPINTGPGGFPIDGQTYTFDTGVPDAQGGSHGAYVPGVDVSGAFFDADGKPKDLSAPTKKTLGQYLSKVTQGTEGSAQVPNKYPVDPSGPTDISATNDKGYPSALEIPPANASTFAGGNEGTIDYPTQNYTTISSYIKKGKSADRTIDGNDLLPGIAGNSGYVADPNNQVGASPITANPIAGHALTDTVVGRYQTSVLSANRFTSAAASYVATSQVDTPDPTFNPVFPVQKKLGYHDPAAQTVSAGQLASIGSLLTMRATGTPGATNPGADPNSAGLQAAALVPGTTQLGLTQVDQQLLLARDILNQLTTNEPSAVDVLDVTSQSWGALNNTDDPFSGTDALGMLTLSVALVAGLTVIIDGFDALVGLVTPQTRVATHDAQGRYALGEYFPGTKAAQAQAAGGIGGALSALSTLNFGALLGIQPTNFPLNAALQAGFNAFFGIAQGSSFIGQLAGAVTSSTDSPGFNVVVARAITRSSITVTEQLKKIGGNLISAINAVLALVDVIRSSKIIGAINAWAMVGDAILSIPSDYIDQQTAGGVRISSMDSRADVVAGAIGKSRLKNSLKLAWASNTAPANVLLPASIIAANLAVQGLGQFSPFLGVQTDPYSQVQSTVTQAADNGRIDPLTAQVFEDQLGASYVPFYFHDVRTNEMVSFHAFLASLSDDYSAGYEKTDGYGRGEAVKVYKSTERRISMSFFIAATSLPDFDDMWVKINKLVTMVYPQYTQGVQLQDSTGNYVFTQPFSQLIGASPMVRIRLGDLLRSNYSLFALGRLFGMGNTNFTVNGEQLTGAESIDQSVLDNVSQQLQMAQANPNSETYQAPAGNWPLFVDSGNTIGISVPVPSIPGITSNAGPQFSPTFNTMTQYNGLFIVKAVKLDPDNPLNLVCEVAFNDDPDFVAANSQQLAAADAVYDNDDLPLQKVIGGKYVIPATALVPTSLTTSTVAGQLSVLSNIVDQNSTFAQDLGEGGFLDPRTNSVAKSFADTGGEGLAGFIESMGFEWLGTSTWETSTGRIAPKMAKCTISFSPIHDIAPGLDHLGFTRSPSYPVGVLGPQ